MGRLNTGKIPFDGGVAAINETGSGKVLRVGTLLVSNITGTTNADVIVAVRRGGLLNASSAFFDGGSYLQLNNNSGLSFSGPFTIEAFVYLTSMPQAAPIIDTRSGGNYSNFSMHITTNSYYRLAWLSASLQDERRSTIPIFLNNWTHVAVVRGSNNVISFFVNGVRDTAFSFADSSTIAANWLTPRIGRFVDGPYFSGYMSELRVSQVARYTQDFTVPTAPFPDNNADTTLLLHMSGAVNSTTFTDSVTSPHTVTSPNTSAVVVKTAQSPFMGQETRLVHRVTIPAGGTVAAIARENPIYLEEGDRIVCFASNNDRLEYACSYEEIG